MKTILEILNLSTSFLQKKGIQNPKFQAECLIADALHLSRIELYQQFDRPLSEAELEICRERLARRAKGEPLQYIHGEMEFYGCRIFVNAHVLIPRQETEILVDEVVKQLEKEDLNQKSLWDVCCGSGCLGIALKKKFPQLKVVLSDISPEALEVAKKNAQENQVDVEFLEGDLLEPFKGRRTDYLISNPPYIAEHEFLGLDHEVRDFEPRSALISGPSGLEFYSKFSQLLKEFLVPSGKVWFEIGSTQGSAVGELFKKAGWTHFMVKKDWAGHDRFFFLENE